MLYPMCCPYSFLLVRSFPWKFTLGLEIMLHASDFAEF
jgi:hypothetical protein